MSWLISESGLENLLFYSYAGEENSFTANLCLKRWWNTFIEFVPLSVAPNILTVLGFGCCWLAYFCIGIVCEWSFPGDATTEPTWYACCIVVVCVFLYQTLDNVDGKQARRTKSSSPLGELFDHCCDSISLPILMLVTARVLNLEVTSQHYWVCFLFLAASFPVFYMAHWTHYFVGEMIFGPFDGPTEAQVGMMALCAVTALFSPELWLTELTQPLSMLNNTPLQLKHVVAFFMIGSCISTLVGYCKQVSRFMQSRPGANDTSIKQIIVPLIPFGILMGASVLWVAIDPSMFVNHPHVFINTLGFSHTYIANRLMLQRMCKQPCGSFYSANVPSLIALINYIPAALFVLDQEEREELSEQEEIQLIQDQQTLTIVSPEYVLYACFVFSIVNYAYLASTLVKLLTNHLKISVFSIQNDRDPSSHLSSLISEP